MKSLGQFLSNNCEFACALTQSIEPIVTDSTLSLRHIFSVRLIPVFMIFFLSFQLIRHRKKQRIISPEPLKCKTSPKTMAKILTCESIDLFDEFLSRSKFFAVDDMLL